MSFSSFFVFFFYCHNDVYAVSLCCPPLSADPWLSVDIVLWRLGCFCLFHQSCHFLRSCHFFWLCLFWCCGHIALTCFFSFPLYCFFRIYVGRDRGNLTRWTWLNFPPLAASWHFILWPFFFFFFFEFIYCWAIVANIPVFRSLPLWLHCFFFLGRTIAFCHISFWPLGGFFLPFGQERQCVFCFIQDFSSFPLEGWF